MKKIKNAKKHIANFFSYTQLGGLLGFRPENRRELQELNEVYKVSFGAQGLHSDTASSVLSNNALRNLLEIDEAASPPQPKASMAQIRDCFYPVWPAILSPLTMDCQTAFDIMHLAIACRFKNVAARSYEQLNSAIVLFTAEFLKWLTQLSHYNYEEEVYNSVLARRDYLYNVLEQQVFPYEVIQDYAIHRVIIDVIHVLENMLPKIFAEVEQKSARERFQKLMTNAEAFVRISTKALFCLFSSYELDITKAFDLTTYEHSQHQGLQAALDTNFGHMMRLLSGVASALSPTPNRTSDAKLLDSNFFVDNDGQIRPNVLSNLTSTKNIGIHQVMNQEDLVRDLVNLLGHISDLGLLLNAFSRLYTLGGRGGDYLVYVLLREDVYALLAAFTKSLELVDNGFKSLSEKMKKLWNENVPKGVALDWCNNYLFFKCQINRADKNIKTCHSILVKVITDMEFANSPEYQEQVRQEIIGFRNIIKEVSKRAALKLSLSTELLPLAEPNTAPKAITIPQAECPNKALQAPDQSGFFHVHEGLNRLQRALLKGDTALKKIEEPLGSKGSRMTRTSNGLPSFAPSLKPTIEEVQEQQPTKGTKGIRP